MNITPVIPDGYDGPIKQLTCRICKHIFYLSMADYGRLEEVSYCHECSLILMEELEKKQEARGRIPLEQTPIPVSLLPKPVPLSVSQPTEPAIVAQEPSIRVPQPRTIDRDKMTLEQLLEEAKMLNKTWRYKEALASYEQALQRDPGCLAAFYGKGETLRQLNRPKEALAIYEAILHRDPTSVEAHVNRGWVLTFMRL